MKKSDKSSPFSFALLLSFNELAWVAVFAMGLVCVYLLIPDKSRGPDPLVDAKKQIAALTNQVARLKGTNETLLKLLAACTNDASKGCCIALEELKRQMTNQLAVWQERLQKYSNQVEELQLTVASLRQENATLRSNLADSDTLVKYLHQKMLGLSNQVARLSEENSHLTQTNAWLTEHNKTLQAEIERLASSAIARELLGLRGTLSNVVILLDRSSSMQNGDRWQDALNVMDVWLQHLQIQKCGLIVFNESYTIFPEKGEYLEIGPANLEQAKLARGQLRQHLEGLHPSGATGTLAALERAYKYPEVDTILLFTDGKPELPPATRDRDRLHQVSDTTPRGSKELMERIHALCGAKRDIPVNVIGLGDYFDTELGKFLLKLSKETGGSFLGR